MKLETGNWKLETRKIEIRSSEVESISSECTPIVGPFPLERSAPAPANFPFSTFQFPVSIFQFPFSKFVIQ
jgi:hypothetical protein